MKELQITSGREILQRLRSAKPRSTSTLECYIDKVEKESLSSIVFHCFPEAREKKKGDGEGERERERRQLRR